MTTRRPTLFSSIPSTPPQDSRWLLATNQRNLFYMLAAGLIMSPEGFADKYYCDPLDTFPGWLPLFKEKTPMSALEYAVSENKHLRPCLVSLNLTNLQGRVRAVSADNKAKEIIFPDELTDSAEILLIPGPLPVTIIESIIFKSGTDKNAFNSDSRNYGNIPVTDLIRTVKPELFSGKCEVSWPPAGLRLDNLDTPLVRIFSAGAMMAMLRIMADLGDDGIAASRLAFDDEADEALQVTAPLISSVKKWQRLGQVPEELNGIPEKLFWGAVEELILRQESTSNPTNDQDVMLEYLESSSKKFEGRLKLALLRLADDLKKLSGFGDKTITELFERHPKSFSRVMTIFFLRDKCGELLNFRHPLLTEQDYLAAAILFAAREGWLGLPLELRDRPDLLDAVTHRMAVMAQQKAGTKLTFGPVPPRPESLRELFKPGPRGWNKKQRDAALALTRACGWDNIQTRITLGKGKYHLEVDGRGMHILLDGEAKAVLTEVDRDRFFSDLAEAPLRNSLEKKISGMLRHRHK